MEAIQMPTKRRTDKQLVVYPHSTPHGIHKWVTQAMTICNKHMHPTNILSQRSQTEEHVLSNSYEEQRQAKLMYDRGQNNSYLWGGGVFRGACGSSRNVPYVRWWCMISCICENSRSCPLTMWLLYCT